MNQLSKAEMEKRELNHLRGGCACTGCECEYAGEQCPEGDHYWGGSSKGENGAENTNQQTNW